MNLSINSWPAAAVIIAAILAALGVVFVLGWRSPEQLGVVATLVTTTLVGALHPQALARATTSDTKPGAPS